MYTTLRTEQKMTADPDATKEETYDKDFWQEYHNNTKEKKNNP